MGSPGPLGAHNWQAMSIDLEAGLAYIPTQENPFFYAIQEDYKKTGVFKWTPGQWNMGIEMSSLAQNILNNLESQPKPGGFLKAFDPLTGETKMVCTNSSLLEWRCSRHSWRTRISRRCPWHVLCL